MIRRRLSTKQREALYESEAGKAREAGRGEFPICNLCDMPITRGREWDESHDPTKPRWLGGQVTGIAHRRCNRLHNNSHDTPLYAKSERVRKRFMDFTRSQSPLPGGRDDDLMRKINGETVLRSTGQPLWRSRT